ncbi:MAG: hypothetical protein ACXAC2_10490, partial [Candidatus Kariarchaeaceae archaeon]
MPIEYPKIERIQQTDDYHGHKVEDPFRFLEDPNDPRSIKFVEENNNLVDKFVDPKTVDFFKPQFRKYNEDDEYSVPFERDGKYFYWRKEGSQLQPIIYMREGLDGEEIGIIDVNKL